MQWQPPSQPPPAARKSPAAPPEAVRQAEPAEVMVGEAAVVGRPDPLTGEAVCAFVVLKRSLRVGEEGKATAKQLIVDSTKSSSLMSCVKSDSLALYVATMHSNAMTELYMFLPQWRCIEQEQAPNQYDQCSVLSKLHNIPHALHMGVPHHHMVDKSISMPQ